MAYDNYSDLERKRRIKRAKEIVRKYRLILESNIYLNHKEAYYKLRQVLQGKCPSRNTLYKWINLYPIHEPDAI